MLAEQTSLSEMEVRGLREEMHRGRAEGLGSLIPTVAFSLYQ